MKLIIPGQSKRSPGISSTALHLCVYPALISVYFYKLLTMFLFHTKKLPTPDTDFKSRNRKHPFLGKPEVGSSSFFGWQSAFLHKWWSIVWWQPFLLTYLIPFTKIIATMGDDCWCSLLNHLFIPHNDSELFIKLTGRKQGFISTVAWGGMYSLKGYFITTQLS